MGWMLARASGSESAKPLGAFTVAASASATAAADAAFAATVNTPIVS